MEITIEDLDDLKAYLSGIRNDLDSALERLEMIEDIVERVEDENEDI